MSSVRWTTPILPSPSLLTSISFNDGIVRVVIDSTDRPISLYDGTHTHLFLSFSLVWEESIGESEGEVSGQFELKTIGRSFQTTTACLIVDDEEITVGTIDVT